MEKQGIQKIEKWANLGKADLHIHSQISDGKPSIKEILEYVEHLTDLDVIVIADHDTMEGSFQAQEQMKQKHYRFELVLGEEITAKEGHILGLFLKEVIPAGLPTSEVIERIRNQNGVAIAVHPFQHTRLKNNKMITMDGIGFNTLLKLGRKFDAVETINATPTLYQENIRASLLNNTMLFRGETGASDAHIVEAIGMGYTLFEGKTALDLKFALKHHQTQAMYTNWTLMALIKYLFFFIPKGLRMLVYTIFHGKNKTIDNI